jgi:hypothetical protein
MSQLSFASLPFKNIKIRAQKLLDEMGQIIPWQKLVNLINPHITPKQAMVFVL